MIGVAVCDECLVHVDGFAASMGLSTDVDPSEREIVFSGHCTTDDQQYCIQLLGSGTSDITETTQCEYYGDEFKNCANTVKHTGDFVAGKAPQSVNTTDFPLAAVNFTFSSTKRIAFGTFETENHPEVFDVVCGNNQHYPNTFYKQNLQQPTKQSKVRSEAPNSAKATMMVFGVPDLFTFSFISLLWTSERPQDYGFCWVPFNHKEVELQWRSCTYNLDGDDLCTDWIQALPSRNIFKSTFSRNTPIINETFGVELQVQPANTKFSPFALLAVAGLNSDILDLCSAK